MILNKNRYRLQTEGKSDKLLSIETQPKLLVLLPSPSSTIGPSILVFSSSCYEIQT